MAPTTKKNVQGVFEQFCKLVPAPEGHRWVLQEKDGNLEPWQLFSEDTTGKGLGDPLGLGPWNSNGEAWEALRCMMRLAEYLGPKGRRSTWQEMLYQARGLPISDLKRSAGVSTNNKHRCEDCFTCACLEVLVKERSDYYAIEGDYGVDGFEEVTAEVTREDAREALRTYRANEPGRAFRMRKVKGK